jgi:hypothetical protein
VYPIVTQPDDGDDLDAASVAQAPQTLANFVAYLIDCELDRIFGTGADGDLSLSGASTTQLSSMKYYDTVTVGSLHLVRTNGWPIICRTKFEITASNAGVTGSASNASAQTSGVYGATAGPHASLPVSNGSSSTAYTYTGRDDYGLGGSGGVGGGSAPTGVTIISPGSAYKSAPYLSAMGARVGLRLTGPSAPYTGTNMGPIIGGGAGSPGAPAIDSGGAGPGGALVVIMAPSIIIDGGFSSSGGNGGAGTTNGNGGGGGGGGAFLFICQTFVDNGAVYSANPGTGGIGVGTGAAGASGTTGNTTPYIVYIP